MKLFFLMLTLEYLVLVILVILVTLAGVILLMALYVCFYSSFYRSLSDENDCLDSKHI